MDITEADIIRMKESLTGIKDPRRERGNLRHKLTDMLVIALTTIIIGEHDFEAREDGPWNGKRLRGRGRQTAMRRCMWSVRGWGQVQYTSALR
jgi:hypothetical protein